MNKIIVGIACLIGLTSCKTAPAKPTPLMGLDRQDCETIDSVPVCVQVFQVDKSWVAITGAFSPDGKNVAILFAKPPSAEGGSDAGVAQPGLQLDQ